MYTYQRSSLALLLCLVVLLACDRNKNSEDDGDDEPKECKTLVWSDEFDGATLDLDKWSYYRGGWGASKVQNCYVECNVSVSDGFLQIMAKYEPDFQCFNSLKDFTSGFIQTKDIVDWKFGYFEARIKTPKSNSIWPAFWMSPTEAIYGAWPRSGEIDVMEIKGHDTTTSYANAHWGASGSDKNQMKGSVSLDDTSEWHIYAVEWRLGELKFYLDNILYHTINDFKTPNATSHPGPFDTAFYLRLNMAVGGSYLVEPHDDATNNLDQFPATMNVDYVRVYAFHEGCD